MDILKTIKIHLGLTIDMMGKLIEESPDSIWNEQRGGFIFWQQILHALTGAKYWLRPEKSDFREPFAERKLYPELDGKPENNLSREELRSIFAEVKSAFEAYFSGENPESMMQPCPLFNKISKLDVIFGQIRHMQHHIGCLNAILREAGEKAVDWEDYLG